MTDSVVRTESSAPVATVDLAIEGMTCASCVMHVEKRLNRVPGVTATVNLALETAHVELLADDAGTPADDDALVAAVRKAGYDARVLSRRSHGELGRNAFRAGY